MSNVNQVKIKQIMRSWKIYCVMNKLCGLICEYFKIQMFWAGFILVGKGLNNE
jgi:hypothetical protein